MPTRSSSLLVIALAVAAAAGCYGLTSTVGGNGNGGPADVPCDVSTVIGGKCISCHGSPPAGGAPMSLTSAAELKAPSASDPNKTMAQVSVERMKAGTMPPGGGATGDTAALEAWIADGYPAGDCTSTGDGGGGGYPGPAVCTNGKGATSQTNADPEMVPGRACIACHTKNAPDEDKTFWVAGTVFPTGREGDDCKGVPSSSGVTVVITDKNGTVHTLTPNAAGNFALGHVAGKFPGTASFAYPYTAVVKDAKGSRAMGAPQTSGDCNSCHGEPPSQGAPGRIVVPGWSP